MIQKLETKRWEELYKNHMMKDFPDSELCALSRFLKYTDKRMVYVYIEEGKEKAYLVTSQNDKIILIQYFAVYEEYRQKGIGTRCLQEYKQMVGDDKIILLEIENPEKAKNKKEYEKRIKRKNFYERIGFLVDKRVKEYYFWEHYLLLTSKKTMPIREVKKEIKTLYKSMTPWYIMAKFYMKVKENERRNKKCFVTNVEMK